MQPPIRYTAPMPRRIALLAAASLFLGAVSTIVIAWVIAASQRNVGPHAMNNWHFASRQGVIYWCANSHSAGYSVFAVESQDPIQYKKWRDESSKTHRQLPEFEPVSWMTIPISDPGYVYTSTAFGWPTLALRGLVVEGLPTRTRAFMNVFTDYWVFGHPDEPRTIALPLGIIWPGFIINTLIYTAAWFVLLFAARRATHSLLTRRRLHRGFCPACRYNLLGDFSSGCPECGWNRRAT